MLLQYGCSERKTIETASPTVTRPPVETDEDVKSRLAGASWLKTERTLNDSRKEFDKKYRLKPDARFIAAITNIQSLAAGKATNCDVRPNESGWSIYQGTKEIGRLPEFPSFAQQYSLLLAYAGRLKKDQKLQTGTSKYSEPAKFSPMALVSIIESTEADLASAKPTNSNLRSYARALTALSIQTLDVLQASDQLTSRALGSLALCESLYNERHQHEKALLADKMHYWSEARQMAVSLNSTDPARHYILQEDLMEQAGRPNAHEETRFLCLKQLSQKRLTEKWRQCVKLWYRDKPEMTLSVLETFAGTAAEESQLPLANKVLAEVNRQLTRADSSKEDPIADLSWTYETYFGVREYVLKDLLTEFEDNLRSSHIESPASISYYRATYYSGIALIADAYMSLPSAKQYTEDFAHALTVDSNLPSHAVKVWYDDRLSTRHRTRSLPAVEADLGQIATIGTVALMELMSDAGAFFEGTTRSDTLKFGESVLPFLDSRPENRDELSQILENGLLTLNLSHRVIKASINNGVPNSLSLKLKQLVLARDLGGLRTLLVKAPLRADERLDIISALEALNFRDTGLFTSQYLKALSEKPHDWQTFAPYYTMLIGSKQYAQAEHATTAWLQAQKSFKFLDEAKARTALAQSLFFQGKYEEGLNALGKVQNTEQYVCLTMKAMLLEKLGRRDEAEVWAKEAIERYKNSIEPIILYTELLWKNGKYSEAAKVLGAHNRDLSRIAWRKSIGQSFISTLGNNAGKCKLAVGALKDEGMSAPDNLGQLAHAAYEADRAELAFGILSDVIAPPSQTADLLVCSYRYLKRWKGETAALAWLTSRVPPKHRESLAPYAFVSGQFDLLWKFIPVNATAGRVWVLRAAAESVLPTTSAKERKLLESRFAGGTDLDSLMGRFLIGKDDQSIFSRIKLNRNDTSLAAFYVGWRKLSEAGQFFNDTDWYRLSIDTKSTDLAEYDWSWIWLTDLALSLRRENKEVNDKAMDGLRVARPGGANWSAQRRFILTDR